MSTFMANKANIERKWYVVDAAGKPLGKTAVIVADLLRGTDIFLISDEVYEHIVFDAVDEQPVWLDVTFTMADPIASQSMVSVFLRERFPTR